MTDLVRRFNEAGILKFKDALADLRMNGTEIPKTLLTEESITEVVKTVDPIDRPGFKTKRDSAEYLVKKLAKIDSGLLFKDAGLWTWLAMYFFEDLCPKKADGSRDPVADPHYILEPQNSKRIYRHLLATPYRVLRAVPHHNRLFLDAPLPIHGDTMETLMSRLFLMRMPSVAEVVELYYFDASTGRIKKGCFPKKAKPGDLRNRIPARVRQLLKTYDVASMKGETLDKLLGAEFDTWRAKAQ